MSDWMGSFVARYAMAFDMEGIRLVDIVVPQGGVGCTSVRMLRITSRNWNTVRPTRYTPGSSPAGTTLLFRHQWLIAFRIVRKTAPLFRPGGRGPPQVALHLAPARPLVPLPAALVRARLWRRHNGRTAKPAATMNMITPSAGAAGLAVRRVVTADVAAMSAAAARVGVGSMVRARNVTRGVMAETTLRRPQAGPSSRPLC